MSSKLAAKVCLIILSLLVMPTFVLAETDIITYQYTEDFHSYAQMVALLNQGSHALQTQDLDDREISSKQLFALLCKTDGRQINFTELSPSYIVAGPTSCFTLFFSSEYLCLKAVESLQETKGIIYAEKDCEVHASSIPSEKAETSYAFHSWGASQMNFSHYMAYTDRWGTGDASVAVIDSGVFPHALISGKLLSSGYDYVDGDEDSLNDLFGHGTNVAGIIADCTNGKPVYIYPIRVLNSGGTGKMSNVVNAVKEAKGKGVTVINLSLESGVMSAALDDAILEAVSSGVTVVAAAGNSSCDTSEVCPAHLNTKGVIVVGSAEGSNGLYNRASYSNYGSSVDVYAFGTNISCCSRSGGYSNETGTSMAAPHISALCALMHLIHPDLSPEQAEQRIQSAASGTGSVIVPDSLSMVPVTKGFSVKSIKMGINDRLALPTAAFPRSSCEPITYVSSDEQVAVYQNGVLYAAGEGSAVITVSCKGFEDLSLPVIVEKCPDTSLTLPAALQSLNDEAFYGASSITRISIPNTVRSIGNSVFEHCDALRWICIPETVTSIGDNTFSDAIILCSQGTAIYQYALEHELQHISLN